MGLSAGVDEAGRGPVLGSMFVSAVRIADESTLPDGVRDSKTLRPGVREELADEIRTVADDIAVIEVDPRTIDAYPRGLNQLTIEASADAVRAVLDGNDTAIIADACDVDEVRYRDSLAANLPDHVSVEAFHGADAREPIVAAASIIAKSEREAHVEKLGEQHGDLGSGYPSDPTTRSYLAEYITDHGTLPPFARRSWSTCQDLLDAHAQETLADF